MLGDVLEDQGDPSKHLKLWKKGSFLLNADVFIENVQLFYFNWLAACIYIKHQN